MRSSFLLFGFLFYSFASSADVEIKRGEEVVIGKGRAYTYVVYDGHCPRSLGVALTKEALEDLPLVDSEYLLKLPKNVELPPFKEVIINWNPHGHEPTDIYGIPHFDFHFYSINEDQRHSIMCTGDDALICMKQPEADYIPSYYVPTPAGVPMMGWHWLDSRSPELHGERFTSTFIYGYYNGKIIFWEPMITREFLLANGAVNAELPMPNLFGQVGLYPTKYLLKYDSEMKVYRIVLRDLVLSH